MPLFQKFLATQALNRYDNFMIDGFVKNLSVPLGAGLRLNPALLDKNPALGV